MMLLNWLFQWQFYAAANPAVVLNLIQKRDDLEAALREISGEIAVTPVIQRRIREALQYHN